MNLDSPQHHSPTPTPTAPPSPSVSRTNDVPRTRPAPPARRPLRRRLTWLALPLLAGLITIAVWPKPISVETGTVDRGPIRVTVNEEGRTRIRQRYVVSAPVAGQLQRLPLRVGAPVVAGETVVAVIEPLAPVLLDARTRLQLEARRDSAVAGLDRARAQHTFAVIDLKRITQLAQERTVSPQEVENVQWRETSAAKEILTAESALRQVEAELLESGPKLTLESSNRAPATITAPVSGKILRLFEESARSVVSGTPLLEVGNPADLEIVIEVLSRDGAAIAPGARIEVDHWGAGPPLEARVRLVEPAAFTKISALGVEEQRVNVIADLITPWEQRPGLGDQFRVEARIVIWEAEQALRLPAGALFRRGAQWSVFALEQGRAVLRPVQIGRSNSTHAELLHGANAGETILLYPSDSIRPGARVQPLHVE